MDSSDTDARIREVVMDWLDTSEDEVSAPMRFHAKLYIQQGETESAALRAEVDRLKKKYETPGLKCNAGHVNNLPLALWDCPMCTEALRKDIARCRDIAERDGKDYSAVLSEKSELAMQVSRLKRALYDECTGQSCGEGCEGGYRLCTGCDQRAKAAYGERWGKE